MTKQEKSPMILVTGANGLNGSLLVARLAAAGHPVRALVRKADKGNLAGIANVEIFEGDMLRPDTLAPALRGVDRAMLISSSAPDMFEVQSTFTDAAKHAGIKHLVKLSGIMPEVDSPFRFARMHGQIERHIEASGLPFTHLRGGEFMHSYFRQTANIVSKGALFLPMENAKIACIDVHDIVEFAAHVLTTSGHESKIYRLTGPEALTMTEVAEKLTKVTGKTIRYVNVPPEDAKKAQLAGGTPPYTADALAELFAERRRGKESDVFPDVAEVLGRPATTFDAFAARHAAIFRGEAPPPKV